MSSGGIFRALRVRNYRLFYLGQLVSLSGSWMQRVAQAWLVLRLTDSPLALGMVTALQFGPLLVLSLFGGVIADRVPKHRLLVLSQAAMACQAVVLAVLAGSGAVELWHVYVLALALGLASAVDHPTRQAFVIEMVGPRDVQNAVALNSTVFNGARIVGPAVGGWVTAAAGEAACFWVNSASYLVAIAALLAMRAAELFDVPRPARGNVLGQLREGIAYALGNREICVLLIPVVALGTFGFNFQTFVPLLGHYVLEAGPQGYGLLFSCMGAGSVAAALRLAALREATQRRTYLGGAAFVGLLFLVAVTSWPPLLALLLAGLGGASIVFSATANARMQLIPPAELRGRVMSIYTMLFAGVTPIGAFTLGTLSERFGVQRALAICAAICLLGLVAGLLYARRQPRPAARAAEARAEP